MERGWKATGRLEAVWGRVGGRDKLAELSGIQPGTLSGYNTGRLPLGIRNARKIAAAIPGVTTLDLGAPATAAAADEEVQILLDHQEALEAQVLRLTQDLGRLARRVAVLERQARPGSGRGKAAQ